MDIASTKRRSGRLLGTTHVDTYRVVLTHPHDRRMNVVVNLRNVITVTHASLVRVFGEVVASTSRPQNVDPGGSWASHTSAHTVWSLRTRMIDERIL